MTEIGFKQSTSDPCVFVRTRHELEILAVYVDDLILITESTESMNKLKRALKEHYKMIDMGVLSHILGITVVQDKEKKSQCTNLLISQWLEVCCMLQWPHDQT